MKKKSSFAILFLFFHSIKPLTFAGLTETGITKNNFLCNQTTSSSIPCNSSGDASMNLHDDQIIQLFNDQAYWLHQEANSAQYAQTVLAYSADEIQEKLASLGWVAMGGFCIIITTNTLLGDIIQPDLKVNEKQKKVIVQLWYNGKSALELWSQDVQVVAENQTFQIAVSNQPDSLASISSIAAQTLKTKFLTNLSFQPKNRNEKTYQAASQSPRSVKIQA